MALDASILRDSVDMKPVNNRNKEAIVPRLDTRAAVPKQFSPIMPAPCVASASNSRCEPEDDRCLRAKNKRLATIFEEHGQPFKEARSAAELRTRQQEAEKMRVNDVQVVMKQLRAAQTADLCFVIDATGSMASHINGVKNMIAKLVQDLLRPQIGGKRRSSLVSELRLACVAYRDYGDAKQYEKLDFTSSVDQFRTFVSSLTAAGGLDEAEDVLGGLNQARKLSWSNLAGTKVIFHIGDAPAHGTQFNKCTSDNYPKGHPSDPTLEDLFGWMRQQQQHVFYFFGKIYSSTDLMISMFEKQLKEKITCFDVANPEMLLDAAKASVAFSVCAMAERSKMPPTKVAKRCYTLDKNEPDWDKLGTTEGLFQIYVMPSTLQDILDDKPLGKCEPSKALVKIAPRPFAQGAERAAFYGLDLGAGDASKATKIVFKEFIHEVHRAPSSKYEQVNQMQTACSYLALRFTEALKDTSINYPVQMKFLAVRTFVTKGHDGNYRFMSCEHMYRVDDKIMRFSNNAGYTMLEKTALESGIDPDYVELVMTFSHWTHHITGGKLMVVDLEGIVTLDDFGRLVLLLTDPAIHCVDMDRYGNLNHGQAGMDKFFETHKCGSFCEALKLPVIEPTTEPAATIPETAEEAH